MTHEEALGAIRAAIWAMREADTLIRSYMTGKPPGWDELRWWFVSRQELDDLLGNMLDEDDQNERDAAYEEVGGRIAKALDQSVNTQATANAASAPTTSSASSPPAPGAVQSVPKKGAARGLRHPGIGPVW